MPRPPAEVRTAVVLEFDLERRLAEVDPKLRNLRAEVLEAFREARYGRT